jgi:hypothetical protein
MRHMHAPSQPLHSFVFLHSLLPLLSSSLLGGLLACSAYKLAGQSGWDETWHWALINNSALVNFGPKFEAQIGGLTI